MRQFGSFGTYETGNSSVAPVAASSSYLSVMPEIHILLVDHDSESRINTTSVLELCRYRVSEVDLAGGALQMLLAGKWKFDLILANVNSPDLQGYQLLQQANAMEIPLILTGSEENSFLARRALDNGVYLFLRKPITKEVASCLWQYVTREKLRLARERERQVAAAFYTAARGGVEIREPREENRDDSAKTNNAKSKKNGRKGDFDKEDDGSSGNRGAFIAKVKKRMCTEWTRELHNKFVDAVEQLGEGRCFPKEILELMDVPGLTRMQVASHLQKCRNDNWRAPEERKSNSTQNPTANPYHLGHSKMRQFGAMPKMVKTVVSAAASKDTSRGDDSTAALAREGSKTPGGSATEVQNGGGAQNVFPEPLPVLVSVPVANRTTDEPLPYCPAYRQMVPLPENAAPPAAAAGGPYPVNPRNASDDFLFNFNEMDSLVQTSEPRWSAATGGGITTRDDGSNIASSSGGGFHLELVYRHHLDQNVGGTSMDSRTHLTTGESSEQDSESTRSGR